MVIDRFEILAVSDPSVLSAMPHVEADGHFQFIDCHLCSLRVL